MIVPPGLASPQYDSTEFVVIYESHSFSTQDTFAVCKTFGVPFEGCLSKVCIGLQAYQLGVIL